jgi:hypothetical protein
MFDSTYPMVSVVILNFNGKKFLSKYLGSVLLRGKHVVFLNNGKLELTQNSQKKWLR